MKSRRVNKFRFAILRSPFPGKRSIVAGSSGWIPENTLRALFPRSNARFRRDAYSKKHLITGTTDGQEFQGILKPVYNRDRGNAG
jgi:hypothetical protein